MNPFPPHIPLIGCGILHKEVQYLIQKNHWQVESQFLDSALHNHLDKLSEALESALHEQGKVHSIIFYGSCHPLMEKIVKRNHAVRTAGQNCITMLIGHKRFMAELTNGAYFLLEDWALTWEPMITHTFGKNPTLVREIFHGSHKYMVAIRTPCSANFTQMAEKAAHFVDLPLQWMDTSLDHLEIVLADAINRCQRAKQND